MSGSGGDDEAYAAVFRANQQQVFALALRLCGDRGQAEDAVAEAFARTYLPWRRGRVDNVEAYLRRAVVNEITNGWRRRARERAWLQRQDGDDRGQPGFETQADDAAAFRQALARLSPRQRAALVLRYWEDLPESEIAAALGCSQGAVKSHLHRGVQRLRGLLGPTFATETLR